MKIPREQIHLGRYNTEDLPAHIPKKVIICDVTLREGDQTPGVALSLQEKIDIARSLDAMGVGQIQLGLIRAKEVQTEAREIAKMSRNFQLEVMTAGNSPMWEEEIRLAIEFGTEIVHSNFALSPYLIHMYPLISTEEIINRAGLVVSCAREKGAKEVNISLLDAPRTPWDLLEKIIVDVCRAGATRIRVADSVGTAIPRGMFTLANKVRNLVYQLKPIAPPLLGTHCHNDLGLATANTIACVEAGMQLVDLAVNGLGERAGNADLAEVVTILEMVYGVDTGIQLDRLMEISEKVARITRKKVPGNKPLIGGHVFSDQEQIHIDAYLKEPFSFQGFNPELLGNRRKFLLGKVAGNSVIKVKLQELGLEIPEEKIPLLRDRVVSLAYERKGQIIADEEFRKLVLEFLKKETSHEDHQRQNGL